MQVIAQIEPPLDLQQQSDEEEDEEPSYENTQPMPNFDPKDSEAEEEASQKSADEESPADEVGEKKEEVRSPILITSHKEITPPPKESPVAKF